MPGIVAASTLTFIPAIGDFVTPDILGGAQTTTIAKIVQIAVPRGARLAGRFGARRAAHGRHHRRLTGRHPDPAPRGPRLAVHRERNRLLSALRPARLRFLFIPIASSSCSASTSRNATSRWRGFTLEWYPTLFHNDDLLQALVVTLQVAGVAVIVLDRTGTLLGLGLARMRSRAAAGNRRDAAAAADGGAGDHPGHQPAAALRRALQRQRLVRPDLASPISPFVSRTSPSSSGPGRWPSTCTSRRQPGTLVSSALRGLPLRDAAAPAAGHRGRGDARLRALLRRPDHHDLQRRPRVRRPCRCTSIRAILRRHAGDQRHLDPSSWPITAVAILLAWRLGGWAARPFGRSTPRADRERAVGPSSGRAAIGRAGRRSAERDGLLGVEEGDGCARRPPSYRRWGPGSRAGYRGQPSSMGTQT